MKRTSLYYFSAFISGLVVMAMELSATRLLAPYFGNSLYVWTNVIALIMLALAIGYYLGGRFADRHSNDQAYFALVLITGLWIVIIPFFSAELFSFLLHSFPNVALAEQFGSFFAILFVFAFPMFLLGMMVPFTVKLIVKKVQDLGQVSGKISMVSTLGSLLGTFLPAFVLVPYLGTTKTFVFMGLMLVYLSAYGLRNWRVFILATIGLGLFWTVPAVYARSDIIANTDSPYGYLFITETDEGIRSLHIDNPLGTQSIYDPASPIPDDRYYYSYFGVLPGMVEEPKKVLILGHGAGTFTRIFNAYYPELELTGVELDPEVSKIAEAYMGLNVADIDLIHGDARTFLASTDQSYDLILVDTYHVANIPAHLASMEFFELASSHLNEGGVLALNAAAKESELLLVLENTLAKIFPVTASVHIPDSYNTMLLGRNSGGFAIVDVPAELQKQKDYVSSQLQNINFAEATEVFLDDKPARVDILTEEMSMDLLSDFTLR